MNNPADLSQKAMLDKLDQCEARLQEVVADFENMLNASIELYDKPENKAPHNESAKKLAERLRNFKNLIFEAAKDLPNDEPLKSHESDFDDYLISNSRVFIMNKIREIKQIVEKKYIPNN